MGDTGDFARDVAVDGFNLGADVFVFNVEGASPRVGRLGVDGLAGVGVPLPLGVDDDVLGLGTRELDIF